MTFRATLTGSSKFSSTVSGRVFPATLNRKRAPDIVLPRTTPLTTSRWHDALRDNMHPLSARNTQGGELGAIQRAATRDRIRASARHETLQLEDEATE